MKIMKEKIKLFKEKIHNSKFNLPVRNILLAIVINLAVEMLSRHSVLEGLVFMGTRPLQFLYGVLVVMFTLTVSSLFRRRVFVRTLVCGLWIICGIVNFVVTDFRHTPFTAQDLRLIKYAYTVAPVYLSAFQIILILVLAVCFIAVMVVWWFKAPKLSEKINYFKALVVILSFWFVVWGSTKLCVTFGILAQNFGNIGAAYDDYGFAYCFSSSLLNSGIDKPKDYNEDTIREILAKMDQYESGKAEDGPLEVPTKNAEDKEEGSDGEGREEGSQTSAESGAETQPQEEQGKDDVRASEQYPNIIFVQLESLFNPELLSGVKFSRTVLPNLTLLYKRYSSGFLSVPSVGAGTANTEFEVISGMNLNDFGPGEYPYKTVLMHNACESICYDLKEYGYATHALHNNDGTFYDRNTVFSQLGFDDFTSVEYMNGLEYNLLGWADDSVLTGEILGILESTEGRDFIYTISVQGHGDYPEDYAAAEGDITVAGEPVKGYVNQLTYYANQIHQMDEFVSELIRALGAWGEPVVLVMYGDHLPAFDITDEQLSAGNTYTTQYVIWNNIGLEKADEDIEAFQLSSHVFDMLGLEGGAISRYHSRVRNTESEEEYLRGLKLLEYDILYGDKEVYGGSLPYAQTNLQMGYKNITINGVSNADDHVVVIGQNFTPYSYVKINGEYVETIYSSDQVLLVDGMHLEDGDEVAVVQKGKDGMKLSSTSLYVYKR